MFRPNTKADPREQLSGTCSLCQRPLTCPRSNTVTRLDPWGEQAAACRCSGKYQGKDCPGIVFVYPTPPIAKPDYPSPA